MEVSSQEGEQPPGNCAARDVNWEELGPLDNTTGQQSAAGNWDECESSNPSDFLAYSGSS
eukprot:COSAG01_NODE_64821_length_275_cov_0.590909_1_plen_59_part_01